MNPYILQGQPMQDLGGLSPVFQNFGQQQANQQAALAQQNQLAQQAGQTQQGGMNPIAMAMMLRKKDPTKPAPVYDKSEIMPDTPQYANPAYMDAGY
jgi:cell division inhibitor SulA